MIKKQLAGWLMHSSLTPGTYTPSEWMRQGDHAGVYAGDTLLVLTGASDDALSITQAKALCASAAFADMVKRSGMGGHLSYRPVQGSELAWPERTGALVSKPRGKVEYGDEDGPLVAIVFDESLRALTAGMCVITEVAQIFDPLAPAMAHSAAEYQARLAAPAH